MKLLIIATTIFFSAVFCVINRYMGEKIETERFMQKAGDNSMNWLELVHDKDSIRGIFYGVEKMSDGKSIYYKSSMNHLTLANGNIRFVLTDYLFSEKPFESGKVLKQFSVKDTSKLPALLRFPQNYEGMKTSDSMKLRRNSMLYDSKFDELIFVRVE